MAEPQANDGQYCGRHDHATDTRLMVRTDCSKLVRITSGFTEDKRTSNHCLNTLSSPRVHPIVRRLFGVEQGCQSPIGCKQYSDRIRPRRIRVDSVCEDCQLPSALDSVVRRPINRCDASEKIETPRTQSRRGRGEKSFISSAHQGWTRPISLRQRK